MKKIRGEEREGLWKKSRSGTKVRGQTRLGEVGGVPIHAGSPPGLSGRSDWGQ